MNSATLILAFGLCLLAGVKALDELICASLSCPSCKTDSNVELITSDGCPTCDCAPDPCQGYNCPYGQYCALQVINCFTAPCQSPQPVCRPCPVPLCAYNCPGGYKLDQNGCQTCECKHDVCPSNQCPPGERCVTIDVECVTTPCNPVKQCQACPPVLCKMWCPYGFDVDNQGCQTCRCRKGPCENKNCPPGQTCIVAWPLCLYGSYCAPFGMCVECPQVRCEKHCPYGYADTFNGCPGCSCLRNPCDDLDCPDEKVCVTKEVPCSRGWGCPHKAKCVSKNSNHVSCPEIGDVGICIAYNGPTCQNDNDCGNDEKCCVFNACNSNTYVCKKFVLTD